MPRVAVIGAGLIGRAWSMVFARAGWDVALFDPVPGAADQTMKLMPSALEEQAAHGLVKDAKAALARIAIAKSVADALNGAELVQENGPEDVAIKKTIWAELDQLAAPMTILASSTSAIVASRFTEGLKGRARCLVAHPVNPPHLVPLVELCGAPWTSPEVVARARGIYESIGQVPIVLNREIDGFILNRLQAVLLNEAFRLVGEGNCTAADLDKTIKDGLGLRWSFMGPFETIELNAPGGIPDYCARFGKMWSQLASRPYSPDILEAENVARVVKDWGRSPTPREITAKSQWRDDRLAALIAHKREQSKA